MGPLLLIGGVILTALGIFLFVQWCRNKITFFLWRALIYALFLIGVLLVIAGAAMISG
jgi:hypothetical protein